MMTLIANIKGGTGKSTIVLNLGIWLAYKKKEMVLVDLDPQLTLTDAVEVRDELGWTPRVIAGQTLPEKLIQNVHYVVDVGAGDTDTLRYALNLADTLVIPVAPSQADIWSTQRFLAVVEEVNQIRKNPIKVFGLINRADTHANVRETIEAEEALDMLPLIERLPVRLYLRTAYRRSFSEGAAVFEMDAGSKATFEINKLAKQLFA